MSALPGSPPAVSHFSTARFARSFAQFLLLAIVPGIVLLGSRAAHATTYTVTDITDSATDTGSIRYAVNSAAKGDAITFAPALSGTIYLANGTLTIANSLTISGPGANQLTISGANAATVFTIDPNVTVSISGLTISEGRDGNFGIGDGGISNLGGALTLTDMIFSGNRSGILNEAGPSNTGGALTVTNCTFVGNNANERIAMNGTGGGMYVGGGTVLISNSTFSGNTAADGAAIAIDGGTVTVSDSTVSGNSASGSPQTGSGTSVGGGIAVSSPNELTLINSIVAGNMTNGVPGGDCDGCGTQSSYNLIGGNPDLAPLLSPGGNVMPTMVPLPGSPAIQAGDPTKLPPGLTTDERGFPRLTGGKLDLGAVQTNYTGVQFVQQPTNALVNATIAPPVTVQVFETNTNLHAPNNTDPVYGIPITLTFNGAGTLGGTLMETTTGGGASFANLSVATVGTGDTLATELTVTPAGNASPLTLTATSEPFDIVLAVPQSQTIAFTPPTSVTYGAAPITLTATATSGLPVTFQVDSGPGTLSGNTLTFTGAGMVVVEADQAGNASFLPAPPVVAHIAVQPAIPASFTLTANPSSLVLGQGQAATSIFTVTPQGGYSGTVGLSCSGLPVNTTCAFSPSTLVLTGNDQPMTSQLTVTTQVAAAMAQMSADRLSVFAIFWLPGLLLCGFAGGGRKERQWKRRRALLLVIWATLCVGALMGCGGSKVSSAPSVPAGRYTVTVTAAVGSYTQAAQFTLTITG